MQELAGMTLVLADEHAIVREGIAALCSSHGMRVLAKVADGGVAIDMIADLNPDFAILDLHKPGMTSLEVIRKLRTEGCTVKLLILSNHREENTVMEALRAGADAYLLKDGPSRHLLDAISFVRDGGVYVSPMLREAGLFTKFDKSHPEDGGDGGMADAIGVPAARLPRLPHRPPRGASAEPPIDAGEAEGLRASFIRLKET
jgi:DNA-binding NarL/FixJ family response regulator